jgi:hypothetical protein
MTDKQDLRDTFAMAALPSILYDWYQAMDFAGDGENAADIAAIAYHVADAMIEARKAKGVFGGI